MIKVASLRYGVIFKKAFCDVSVFKGFVRDILGINLEIDTVETEKEFDTLIGSVKPRFDLYAEDKKNRVIVDIQHRRDFDHYDRFLHYHCLAILEQVKTWLNYKPPLAVYTIVVLTSGDKHKTPVSVIDFDPKDLDGTPLGEIPHKVIFLCPKYMNDKTPELYREWLRVIEESLSGIVDETMYHLSEVETVLHHIEQDGITPEERYWMIEELSIEKHKKESREEGFEEGREEGELAAKQTIAKGMLEKGIDIATITDITGLTVDEIQS
jgi:predicted transposase/invertase (TIGR01784 family)